MIGRQVTISSKSTIASSVSRGRARNTSIHTEVSTSTTAAAPIRPAVLADLGELAFPQPASGEIQDTARLRTENEVSQRTLDGPRIGALSAQERGLLEQTLIKHKIRTFHVYRVHRPGAG